MATEEAQILLEVTPDRWLPNRYAGASGDFNPVHVDAEYANAAGLPAPILHGLYVMAQVARAITDTVGGDPRRLRRLSVQFRGLGFTEQPITVEALGAVEQPGARTIAIVARQQDRELIRNATATLTTEGSQWQSQ